MNLSLIQTYWRLADAKREGRRESARMYDLDLRQAELSLRIAKRQEMITQRTGRLLDIEQAHLATQRAARDIELTRFAIEDKRRKTRRDLILAEEQLNLMEQQRVLLMAQIITQTGLMITNILALTAAHWAEISALVTKHSVATLGIALPAIGLAMAGAYALVKSYEPDMSKVQSAQTDYGDVKQIAKGGIIEAHEGEYISRERPASISSTTSTQYNNIHFHIRTTDQRSVIAAIETKLRQTGTYPITPIPAGVR